MKEKIKEFFHNNKKSSLIATFLLFLIIIGATYAFLDDFIGNGSSFNVTISSKTVDLFTFSKGGNLTIGPATEENFYEDGK